MALESVKELYYSLEDKWYATIDRIDSKVPIHGIVDRVDKVVPSFALFLAIIVLIAAVLIIASVSFPAGVTWSFKIVDADGSPIENATVTIYVEEEEVFSGLTNEGGETESVWFDKGTSFTIAVSKRDFLDYTDGLEANESTYLHEISLEALEEKTYNIALKDSAGQPVRVPMQLSFSCVNTEVEAPDGFEVSSGVATVTAPAGCDGLIVSARGDGFKFKDSVKLVQNEQTIYLEEDLGKTGSVRVELYSNGELIEEQVTVYLYKDNGTDSGLGPVESALSDAGVAVFERQPGSYFVKSSGSTDYAAASSDIISLSTAAVETVRLDLERNVVGSVKLRIVDERTGSLVDGADVLLRLGSQEIDRKISSEEEDYLEFPVSRDTSYTIVIDHEAYCFKTVQDAAIGEAVREIELKPFTDDCGGKLKVRVLDQDGYPVRNATVGLYNPDGFGIGFGDLITDLNGEAEFSRVPSGDYLAFGFKANSSGWSDVGHFIQRSAERTVLTVVLISGDGIVRVNVSDDEGNPLPFSKVAIVDAQTFEVMGEGPMPVDDLNGSVELSIRADKKVYIIASRNGYTTFISTVKPVLAGSTQAFNAVLEREIIQGEVKVKFKGLFKDGKAARNIAPAQEYDALFEIRVPANKNYDSMGIHIRTGKHDIMELDNIVIKEINVPGRVNVLKATSYSPGNGYAVDSEHLSSDEAKWVNLRWAAPHSGIMMVSAKIRIKETAHIGDQLNLHYRAWGEVDGSYKRDPVDQELGNSESIAGKESLYAHTNQEIFQLDIETICDEKFCFSASALDLEDELAFSATDGFEAKVSRAYKLGFTILNNSEFETNSYMNAEIRISSPGSDILLQNYSIFGAQNQVTEGIASGGKTDWIGIGNLLPDNQVNGEIFLNPEKSGPMRLRIDIRSNNRLQFGRDVPINVASEREMLVVITPEMLPSGIENSISVSVKGKKTGAEIGGAIAKVKDRFDTVIAERQTNTRGNVELRLPGLQPGEKLRLSVTKPDYESFEKIIEVDPEVIKVKPTTIGVALNSKIKVETQAQFSVENKTSFDITVKSIKLNGKLYGLVDREKVNNQLHSYVGETIKASEVNEMVMMSFLTEKGKKLKEARQLEASLEITVQALGNEWVKQVPVKISIGLGGEVDDPACFVVTRKEWKASTEGVPIEVEFEVQNNCSISGSPISLRNLSAEAKWETNQLGTFSVRTEDNAIDVRTGYPKKFRGVLDPEETITVVLAFTPSAGVNGKGVAVIDFSAENPTESGAQLVSNKIAAELTVVNVAECMSFSKEVLRIKPENSDTFTIETINCGPKNEIKLVSDLTLSVDKFTLGDSASKEIEVLAEKNVAGQYPINVYAKGSDELQYKLVKTVRARILAGGCLELSKYEFDIFDNPDNPYDGYDTAEIINHCYEKEIKVNVRFDEKDLVEAMKEGAIYGLIGGTIGGFMAAADGRSWLTGEEEESSGGKTDKKPEEKKNGDGDKTGDSGTKPSTGSSGGDSGVTEEEDRGEGAEATEEKASGGILEEAAGAVGGVVEGIGSFIFGGGEGDGSGSGEFALVTVSSPTGGVALGALDSPTGLASGGRAALGGVLGNLFKGIGENILGESSFLGWGLWSFAIGTIVSYMDQDSGSFSFTPIAKDLRYEDVKLLMPGAALEENRIVEEESTDIIVQDLEETSTMPLPAYPRLNMEKRKLGFLNFGNLVQEDPSTPFFRVLRIDGERLGYKKDYKFDKEKHPTLEINERKEHKERFRLQFNSFDPLLVRPGTKPIPNCTLGTVVGVTGPDAVPRVKFDWSWSRIGEDECDEGNEDYIYCDATQFSIEVLKKVQRLRQFIESNKPFECPSSSSGTASREQPLTGTAYDVGIVKIQANKTGSTDANIQVVLESSNARTMEAQLTVNVREAGSLVKSCTRQFSLISKSIQSCEFTGLGDGEYTVEGSIVPTLCEGCENNDSSNDTIEVDMTIGDDGISECEPYNTERLVRFLEASDYAQSQIDEVQNLVKFNAYLVKDAYTNDFRADFDEFCKDKSFFDCPIYYLEDDGLNKFFKDGERFKFDYSMAPHAPADAGKYSVTINIEFDNQNWNFFDNGVPAATVNIGMVELAAPEPDSPFYYLPFDGTVGVDSANGRQGYGVNFRQTSQETIKVNNALDQTIVSTNIAGSTPIFNGWIDAGFNDEFGIINQTKRGILLDVQADAESTKVTLMPSYATPIMMQVDYEKGQDAYGFYSVEIDYSPQASFTKMIPWSGFGITCRDFADNPVTEAWQDTWDMHGGISGNLRCALGTDITDYGIEWCSPKRAGSVYLQSVIFTPQSKSSVMKRTAYSDEMTLYNDSESGSQISLNGVPGMPSNSFGTSGIDSLEDVFELVRENKVCLVGQGNRISNRFFWNPKVVLEEISDLRTQAEQECIEAG
jgi:hypothetical protein